jgi:hypothetical protein
MAWRPLPCDELIGLDTLMVESLHSWLSRQLQRSACHPKAIYRALGLSEGNYWPSTFDGLSCAGAVAVDRLSVLMEAASVKRGTFRCLHEIASKGFQGCSPQHFRWCPICAGNSAQEPYLPLVFTLESCRICPTHGCRLLDKCHYCHAVQRRSWDPCRWRQCHGCRSSLAVQPNFEAATRYDTWVQHQSEQLIAFCSTQGRETVGINVLLEFLEGLSQQRTATGKQQATFKIGSRPVEGEPLTLRRLMILAACSGVGVTDILDRPSEAAAAPLFAPWRSQRSLRVAARAPELEVAINSVAMDGAWLLTNGYVPEISAIARGIGMPTSMMDDLGGSSWDAYEDYGRRCRFEYYLQAEAALPQTIREALLRLDGKGRSGGLCEAIRAGRVALKHVDSEVTTVICLTAMRIAVRFKYPSISTSEFERIFEKSCLQHLG